MSRLNRAFFASLFFFLLASALLFSQLACSTTQREEVLHLGQSFSAEVDRALEEPTELVFAGQIEDANGRWLNDCVVVLFKNGEEVTRTTSRLMDSPFSNNGPMDGVFELRIPNIYKLSLVHEFYHADRTPILMRTASGMVGTRYLGTWFDDLNPKDMQVLHVPDKQLEYALVVLSMRQDELPESHQRGNLRLNGGILVTNLTGTMPPDGTAMQATAVPNPTPVPQANIQFTVLPSENGGLAWNLQMTGYYGNRWDVWEQYLSGRVPGMSWEAFKEAVLVYNPHLETDSFVFYPEKVYLLPFSQ